MLDSTNSDPDFMNIITGDETRNLSFSLQWKPKRALNTASFKNCLPSTDAIDRLEKNSRMQMKVQGRFMQTRFIEIHQVFSKQKVGYF